MKKLGWVIAIILIVVISLIPYTYLVIEWPFGLLTTKSEELLENPFWKFGFYLHIIPGSIALLSGWSQFIKGWRDKNIQLHRALGQLYIISVLLSALGGLQSGFYATGGWVAKTGFIALALVWFSSTLSAYLKIRNRDIDAHEKMMIYSYAACLAAVTLRIWNPLLIMITGDFYIAYPIVAWLCWVPNLIVARKLTM